MRQTPSGLSLSATDLSNFLGCRHRTSLVLEVAHGDRKVPYHEDPLLDLLKQRGIDHENSYVDSLRAAGREVLDLSGPKDRNERLADSLAAMHAGVDVIVQGSLQHVPWFGHPDIMQRTATPSALGQWSYEIADTKLSRETKPGAILQLALYSEMLTLVQGVPPEYFHVITPDPIEPTHSFRFNDYSAYFRLVRDQFAREVTRAPSEIAAEYYPEPVGHCDICPWSGDCNDKRHLDDHLSLVAGISRLQRRELEQRDARTLAALGRLPLPLTFKPDRGSVSSYVRVREQARLQLDSRGKNPPLHELREGVEGEGFCRLPAPTAGDIFLDLEGDAFSAEGGREYLFGLVTLGGDGGWVYRSYWAFTDADERCAFEAVIDLIVAAHEAHPGMHVFHYAPYETTAFKRLMGRYATRESELDGMLRAGRFVDLYAVVRQGLRAGIERYSIKNLEPMYDFTRAVPLADANRGLRRLEAEIAYGRGATLPLEVRNVVEGYNKDDCVSTLHLREWLERLRAEEVARGSVIERPPLKPSVASAELTARQLKIEALRAKLLAGIEVQPAEGSAEHARWMLAYLLDYHRREDKAGWWKYFELCAATDEELVDEPQAAVGLEYLGRVSVTMRTNGKPTGTVVDRYRYPAQEMEIREEDELKTRDGAKFGEVVAADRAARTLDVKKGKVRSDEHAETVFAHTHVSTMVLESAIETVGVDVTSGDGCDGANAVARALLLREPPRLRSGAFRQPDHADASAFAVDACNELDRSVLAIQGPPGSGKTFTGAQMICALVARGKKVGVVGPSHKVITNLLAATVEAARRQSVEVRIGQKRAESDVEGTSGGILSLQSNEEALEALRSSKLSVVGGTAWLWARSDMASSVDVLFVDEAGQLSLANALAVSAAARSMVLLGDPQQLDSPVKGSHPAGVSVSVLEHLLGGHNTIPAERGIFLPVTWRLSPKICDFTSKLFYEGRLASKAALEHQALVGLADLEGSGLWYLDVEHDGCTSASDEEAKVVQQVYQRLIAAGSMWCSEAGARVQLTTQDVLVVSPFNAQVSRLIESLPAGARVGTVDKFQGQEAPVVIYSMATSRPEDAPRGMEFLYSLNRFNVATSRARCAVIVVANRRLYEPECRSPRQMKLANALCAYREMGRPMGLS